MTAPMTFSEGDTVALANDLSSVGTIIKVRMSGITTRWPSGEVTTNSPRQLVHREVVTT